MRGDEFLLDVNWVRNNRGRLMLMADRRLFEEAKYLWFSRCRVYFFFWEREGEGKRRGNNLYTQFTGPSTFEGSDYPAVFFL